MAIDRDRMFKVTQLVEVEVMASDPADAIQRAQTSTAFWLYWNYCDSATGLWPKVEELTE